MKDQTTIGDHGRRTQEPEKKGGAILTFTGKILWPLDPCPEEIDILDIAHALALQNRFAGHTREPYSVAQHSIVVSNSLPDELALVGLLHDAAEAYLVDIPAPIKRYMPEYKEWEVQLESVIAQRFDLPFPWPPQIKAMDLCARTTEQRDLMGHISRDSAAHPPFAERIVPMSWRQAEDSFLLLFRSLQRIGG